MASLDYDLSHSNAKSLAITIPNTVTKGTVRICDKGDKYVAAIEKAYTSLASAFDKIAKHCNTALNNSNINTKFTKDSLTKAKKSAMSRETWSKKRKQEIRQYYDSTADMFTLMNMKRS